MAIVDQFYIGDSIQIVTADADPTSSGVDVPVGSLLILTDGSASFFKSGATSTQWSRSLLGVGTSTYIPKFTGSGIIGNSSLTDDGTQVTSTLPFYANSLFQTNNLLIPTSVAATASITWAGVSGTTEYAVRISGNTPNTITASYDAITVPILTRTLTAAASGTHNIVSQLAIQSLTVNTGAATTTNAATVYIQGAAGGTETITNNYSLWIDDGTVRLDGNLELQGITSTSTSNFLFYDTTTKRVSYSTLQSFTIRGDSGTTEGTDLFTYNGSTAKSLNLAGGSNISITKVSGTFTFAATGLQASSTNLTSLAGLSYASASFVKMTAANTFSLDTTTYTPTARTTSVASTATLTPDISTGDVFVITAQAVALSVANPTGTPYNGQKMIIRIKDNATARAISWTSGTQYRASSDLSLPSTTTVSKTLYLGFIYNSTDTKWDLIAKLDNFA